MWRDLETRLQGRGAQGRASREPFSGSRKLRGAACSAGQPGRAGGREPPFAGSHVPRPTAPCSPSAALGSQAPADRVATAGLVSTLDQPPCSVAAPSPGLGTRAPPPQTPPMFTEPLGRAAGRRSSRPLHLLGYQTLQPQLPRPQLPADPPGAGSLAVRYFSGEADKENGGLALCPGCPGGAGEGLAQPQTPRLQEHRREGPMEALSGGTGVAWPVQGQEGMLKGPDRKEVLGSSAPDPESQEDAGSGDQHARTSPDQGGFAEWTAVPPTPEFTPEASPQADRGLSSDSAETDLLLDTFGAAALPSPTLSSPTQTSNKASQVPGRGSTPKEEPLELWVESTSSLAAEGAPGRTDLAWLNTEAPRLALTPPAKAVQTPKPSLDPLASEIIDIDYYDLFDGESLGGAGAGADSTKRKPSEDKGMSWSLHDLYDDFTPFDESDFYPTTSFYTDGDEEDLEEPEEEEEEEEDGGEAGKDLGLSGSGDNSTECRSGYVRHNNSCKSVCETFPSYCHNGGQCYLVENLGAFCRCNTQDYIWHKGIRCESIITDFQVMCVAVGSAALVVLLLFMMTVFFAKKLYLLKTENSKLRKTKYRTPSELHNDNFSLSTIAEGSHPNVRKCCDTPCNLSPHARAMAYYDNIICQNSESSSGATEAARSPTESHPPQEGRVVPARKQAWSLSAKKPIGKCADDPSAPQKLQDPLKSCLKEEESFNIQNSMSPKLDNGKGDLDDSEVNCLQNNLT
ncbi:hypothetical protein lerEdw1_005986 [Lerista edwardsae]|nr:hypothetical protein lerEdw1_005986 [Lerista edwardsae]